MASDPYYNTKVHKRWRNNVLRKAKYLCQECARYGVREDATVAHHILPREEYPELARRVSNGAALPVTTCSIRRS